MAAQMFHTQVAKLVTDVKTNAISMLLHRIDYVRQQHNILSTEKFGGKRIESPIATQNVGLWSRLDLQTITASGELCIQVGKLRF